MHARYEQVTEPYQQRILSADSHIVEPPDLWTTRMDGREPGGALPGESRGAVPVLWCRLVAVRRVPAADANADAGQLCQRRWQAERAGRHAVELELIAPRAARNPRPPVSPRRRQ